MREICSYGSAGGEIGNPDLPYPDIHADPVSIAYRSGQTSPGWDILLRNVIAAALARHAVQVTNLSVAVVNDAEMAALHERHLLQSGPTDVLTFDLRDEADRRSAGRQVLDGEIIISTDTAAREAKRRGHGMEAELALYVVHGVLHLLGYDDQTAAQAERMHAVEDAILVAVGLGPVFASARASSSKPALPRDRAVAR